MHYSQGVNKYYWWDNYYYRRSRERELEAEYDFWFEQGFIKKTVSLDKAKEKILTINREWEHITERDVYFNYEKISQYPRSEIKEGQDNERIMQSGAKRKKRYSKPKGKKVD